MRGDMKRIEDMTEEEINHELDTTPGFSQWSTPPFVPPTEDSPLCPLCFPDGESDDGS